MQTNWSAKDPVNSERIPGRPLGDLARRAARSLPFALAIFLVVAGGLIFATRYLPSVYRSSAVVMITARDGDVGRAAPIDAATRSALVDTGVAALNAPAMMETIFAGLGQKAAATGAAFARPSGPAGLSEVLTARRRGQSYLVDVEAHAATPEAAKAIVEAAIDAYQERQLDQRFAALGASPVAPPAPAAVATTKTTGPDPELTRLEAEKAQLLATAKPAGPAVAADAGAARALAQARSDAAALKTLLRSDVTSGDVGTFRASGAIDRLEEEGAGLSKELAAYEAAMSAPSDSPTKADDVKFHKYQIFTEASRLTPVMDSRVARLASAASASASAPAPTVTPSPDVTARLKLLDLQIEAQRKLTEAVAASRPAPASSPAAAASAGSIDFEVRTVSHPSAGAPSVWRQPVLLYSGAIALALLVALAFAILAAFASNTVINARDAAALVGAPVVAALPRIAGWQLRKLSPSERQPASFAIEQPASPFADAVRMMLAAVRPTAERPEPVCIAIAGAQAGDGVSTVALALGRTAAAAGARVLLIDTDFETAGLTKAMGIQPAAGIEAILGGDRPLADLVVEDDMTSLHLLPSAPSEASRGALSLSQLTALKAALVSAKDAYEMVIIDCQPHSTRSRTRSMSRMADIALIVASCNVTKRDMLSAIARRTQQNGAVLRGVVFNLAPDRSRRDQVNFIADARRAAAPPVFAPLGSDAVVEIRSIH